MWRGERSCRFNTPAHAPGPKLVSGVAETPEGARRWRKRDPSVGKIGVKTKPARPGAPRDSHGLLFLHNCFAAPLDLRQKGSDAFPPGVQSRTIEAQMIRVDPAPVELRG